MVGSTMSRVIAVMACGFALAACSMSMPSFDFLKSTPATETLRLESEPPGADARTPQGQSCRTPCELTVPAAAETSVSFALTGYQPQTVPVRPEPPPGLIDPNLMVRLSPNPVYAELMPIGAQRLQRKKGPAPKRRPVAQRSPAVAPVNQGGAPDPNTAYPAGYPWPDPVPPR
jgi:hypothetical protein